jgi:hypothetical protein
MKHRDTPTTHAAADLKPAEADRRGFLEHARRDIRAYSQSASYLIEDVREGAADDNSTDAIAAQRLELRRDSKFKAIVEAWRILPEDMRADVVAWAYGMPTQHQDKRSEAKPVATRSLVSALFAAMYEHNPRHIFEYTTPAHVKRHLLTPLPSADHASAKRTEASIVKAWQKLDPAVLGIISTDRYWRNGDAFKVASHFDQIDDALQAKILTIITSPANRQGDRVLRNAPVVIELAHRVVELPEANQETLFDALRPHTVKNDTKAAQSIYAAVFAHTSPYRHDATVTGPQLSHRLYQHGDRNWWLLNASTDDLAGLTGTMAWYQIEALGRELVTCARDAVDPDDTARHLGQLAGSNLKLLSLAERQGHPELLRLVMPYISPEVLATNEDDGFAASLTEAATRELASLITDNQDNFSQTFGSEVPRLSYRVIDELGERYLDDTDPTDEVRAARSVIKGYAALQVAIQQHIAEQVALGRKAILTDD